MVKVNGLIDFNKFSPEDKIFWLNQNKNLLFKGAHSTVTELPADYKSYEYDDDLDITPEELIQVYYDSWWSANWKNYWEVNSNPDNFGNLECDDTEYLRVEKSWTSLIEEQTSIQSLKEKFVYTHSLKSYKNEILGELAFYFFMSIILAKKKVNDVSSMDYTENTFHSLPVIIMQDARSGKDESLIMMLALNKVINEVLGVSNGITNCPFEAGTRVETLYNRPRMDRNGRPDEDSEVVETIPGIVQTSDWIFSSECSHLFSKKQGEGASCLDFFLLAWQWRPVRKELTGWNGIHTFTAPNATFWGISRPVPSIKEIITESGLLQRTFFLPRNISNSTKKEMMDAWFKSREDSVKIKEEYRKNIKILAVEFVELLNKDFPPFKFQEEKREEMSKMMQKFVHDKLEYVNLNVLNVTVRKIMESFATGSPSHIERLAQICAFYKKRNIIMLEDVEEAITLVDTISKFQLPWLENALIEEEGVQRARGNVQSWVIAKFKNSDKILKIELTKFLKLKTGKSLPTIYDMINSELAGEQGTDKLLFYIDDEKKVFILNKDYLK